MMLLNKSFLKFLNDLKNINQISIPRYIYGAFNNRNIGVQVNLISSKTKVSPTKEIAVPQLEFMSCVLLTKLLQSVLKGLYLNIASIYCWSDSMIALY